MKRIAASVACLLLVCVLGVSVASAASGPVHIIIHPDGSTGNAAAGLDSQLSSAAATSTLGGGGINPHEAAFSLKCTGCKLVGKAALAYLQSHRNATCGSISSALASVCSRVGPLKSACLGAAREFSAACPRLIAAMQGGRVTPDTLCRQVGMCSSTAALEMTADALQLNFCWPWESCFKCTVCTGAVGAVASTIASSGCGVADAAFIGACEVAGLGPEDPLADACAAALVAGCEVIAGQMAKGVTDPTELCKSISWC